MARVVEIAGRRRARGAPGIRRQRSRSKPKPTSNDLPVMASFSLIALLAAAQAVDVQVTSNPSWWTYVPAGVSALAAIATFGITFRLWRRGATDRAREQASKVYVSPHRTTNGDGSMTIHARVHNESDAPIWDVEVWPRRDGSVYDAGFSQTLPDILPSDTNDWEWTVEKANVPQEERYPELIFVDASQRRWKRAGLSLMQIKPR